MSIYSFFKNLFSKDEITVEKIVPTEEPAQTFTLNIVEELKPTLEQTVAKEVVTPAPKKKVPVKQAVKPKTAPARTVAKKKK